MEPVRRVAHLSGCCFVPRIRTLGTACSREKRPSRTTCLTAIIVPKRKCPIISIIEVSYGVDTPKNGEDGLSGSILWENPGPSTHHIRPAVSCFLLTVRWLSALTTPHTSPIIVRSRLTSRLRNPLPSSSSNRTSIETEQAGGAFPRALQRAEEGAVGPPKSATRAERTPKPKFPESTSKESHTPQ